MTRIFPACVAVFLAAAACARAGDAPPGDRGGVAVRVAPAPERTCGVADTTRLSGTGIGLLRIGAPVAEVRSHCRVRSDSVEADAEAMPQRVLVLDVAGAPVRALVADDRVWRVEIDGPAFQTVDSLRVGSTLSDLLARPEAAAAEGDGRIYVMVPRHCGLSFRLAPVPGDDEHRAEWSARDLARLPGRTAVDLILVIGCDGG